MRINERRLKALQALMRAGGLDVGNFHTAYLGDILNENETDQPGRFWRGLLNHLEAAVAAERQRCLNMADAPLQIISEANAELRALLQSIADGIRGGT